MTIIFLDSETINKPCGIIEDPTQFGVVVLVPVSKVNGLLD